MSEEPNISVKPLAEDWHDNTGSDWLKTTGENGMFEVIFQSCSRRYNDRYKKWEYQWAVLQLPGRIPRIITESSKRFCTMLARFEKDHGELFGQEVRLGFVKERDNKGREGKLWTIIPLRDRIV